MRNRFDETWHGLRKWTQGQGLQGQEHVRGAPEVEEIPAVPTPALSRPQERGCRSAYL